MRRILVAIIISSAFFYNASAAFALDVSTVKRYFFKKDYKVCIKEGKRLLSGVKSRERNLDELYYFLGLCCLKTRDYSNGLEYFRKIKEDFPKSKFCQDAGLGTGDCYFARGDFVLAAYEYRQLLLPQPKNRLIPAVYYRLSQLGERTGDVEQQRLYTEKLKKEFPGSPEAKATVELFPESRMSQPKIVTQATVKEVGSPAEDVPESKPVSEGIYCVQVGAFSKHSNAKNLARKLKERNYPAYVEEATFKGRLIYKVRIGKFQKRSQARKTEIELSGLGYPTKIYP